MEKTDEIKLSIYKLDYHMVNIDNKIKELTEEKEKYSKELRKLGAKAILLKSYCFKLGLIANVIGIGLFLKLTPITLTNVLSGLVVLGFFNYMGPGFIYAVEECDSEHMKKALKEVGYEKIKVRVDVLTDEIKKYSYQRSDFVKAKKDLQSALDYLEKEKIKNEYNGYDEPIFENENLNENVQEFALARTLKKIN